MTTSIKAKLYNYSNLNKYESVCFKRFFGNDYRVVALPKSNPFVTEIITLSVKSIGQFHHASTDDIEVTTRTDGADP